MIQRKDIEVAINNLSQDKIIEAHQLIYYVFKDLENVMGIYAETNASLEYFQNQKNHPYIQIAEERLLIQINLSAGILYDVQRKCLQDNELIFLFQILKQLSKTYFQEILQQFRPQNQEINRLIQHYLLHILFNQDALNQLPLPPVPNTFTVKPQLVENLFEAIRIVDAELDFIRAGNKVDVPDQEKLLIAAVNRYRIAQEKLKVNFPQNQ